MMQAVAITPESSIEEQISRYIEQQVRARPESWMWRYRRWRRLPAAGIATD